MHQPANTGLTLGHVEPLWTIGSVPFRPRVIIALLLSITVFAVYFPSLQGAFLNWDDDNYITKNLTVQQGISWETIVWAFTTKTASNWHPLTWLSHMLDFQVYGLNPWGHHLTNVILHAANTALLFIILSSLVAGLWCPLFVAALFGLHPLHVESVAWISERKDVLSTFLGLASLWTYVAYTVRPTKYRYAGVMVFLTLSLMAKPMLVTMPLLLLLLDYWPLGRLSWRAVWEKVPLCALSILSSGATIWAQHRVMYGLGPLPLATRAANAVVGYLRYVAKFFWPTELAPLYPLPGTDISPYAGWQVAGAAALLGIFSFVTIRQAARRPYLLVAWFWYLIALLPVIGLVQVGNQAIADRYTYVPAIGLSMLIVWPLLHALRHTRSRYAPAITVVAALLGLTLLAERTWQQTLVWQNSVTLWRHGVRLYPNNSIPHGNLAAALFSRGDTVEAIAHYQRALQINPSWGSCHTRLANALFASHDIDGAIRQYRQALRLDPNDAEANLNLGFTLAYQGKIIQAIPYYRAAIRINPDSLDGHLHLASALAATHRLDEAIQHYRASLRIDPTDFRAHLNIGHALAAKGEFADALGHYREAVAISPESREALNNLAWLLATCPLPELRDGLEAVRLAERAVKTISDPDPALLDTLAAAYAEAGRMADAQRTAQKAIALATAQGKNGLATEITGRLQLYESGHPYRSPLSSSHQATDPATTEPVPSGSS